jgi:hypothetical protein
MRITAAVVLLAVIRACSPCPTHYSFPSCTLDVNYLDPSCFTFSFVGCQYVGYTTFIMSSDWTTCTSLCCDSSVGYLMNADSMAVCANYNSWSNTGDIIIITLVMVAFVLPSLVVMTWTLITCYRKCRNA